MSKLPDHATLNYTCIQSKHQQIMWSTATASLVPEWREGPLVLFSENVPNIGMQALASKILKQHYEQTHWSGSLPMDSEVSCYSSMLLNSWTADYACHVWERSAQKIDPALTSMPAQRLPELCVNMFKLRTYFRLLFNHVPGVWGELLENYGSSSMHIYFRVWESPCGKKG